MLISFIVFVQPNQDELERKVEELRRKMEENKKIRSTTTSTYVHTPSNSSPASRTGEIFISIYINRVFATILQLVYNRFYMKFIDLKVLPQMAIFRIQTVIETIGTKMRER